MKGPLSALPIKRLLFLRSFIGLMTMITICGCTGGAQHNRLMTRETGISLPVGSIISAKTGNPISFEELISDLKQARIIYIGESHTHTGHHQNQLKILQALHSENANPTVGMEMFDFTYQSILDMWSTGRLDEATFLRKVHWYANWRYNYEYYRDILSFVKSKQIPLVGLNLPFHIPPKISLGGIDSLSEEERRLLPRNIDLSDPAHREYVRNVFSHHRIPGRENFEYFYEAQCTWEDTMADTIYRRLPASGTMVVLVGNGHIIHNFGIPNRAYNRTEAPFKTIYQTVPEGESQLSYADYIWISPLDPKDIRPPSSETD